MKALTDAEWQEILDFRKIKARNKRLSWHFLEDVYLKANFLDFSEPEIAKELKRTVRSVHARIWYLGLGHLRSRTLRVKIPCKSEELAYLAGFLDADGSIGVCLQNMITGNERMAISVNIHNNHEPLMEYLKTLGFRVTADQRNVRTGKTTYRAGLGRLVDELTFLQAIEPFLRVKRKRAQLAIEFIGSRLARGQTSQYNNREYELGFLIRQENSHNVGRDKDRVLRF